MKALRKELESVFYLWDQQAPRPVFKRAREPHSLLVTDGFRRVREPMGLKNELISRGFQIIEENRLWYIEPPVYFYMKAKGAPLKGELVNTLSHLLKNHPVSQTEPYCARLLLKAIEEGNTENALWTVMAMQAEKLRLKRPLDGLVLHIIEKGETSC